MIIQIEMGPEFKQTIAELGAMGQTVIDACSRGLGKGVKIAAGKVSAGYLSGQALGLKRRTGNLARSIDGWLQGDFHGVVGVRDNAAVAKYKWLLGDEQMTITRRGPGLLAIPIGENLTGAGVGPKFTSPRQVPNGFFVKTGGKLLFGYKNGKKGKFRALFTLVKSVLVQGSGALYDGVMDSVDDITDQMQQEVDRRVS